MKKPHKKISKMGCGVMWQSGHVDFFHNKKEAMNEIGYFSYATSILFRCKIEEVTK